ncbi:lycopene beta-cyclase [Pedobacter westerhofensis]|uniref:Lycopene beta-cyclase n=1 Tax=Pedobacter westerhofensis TaxID=425512 RepID=A0A521FAJ8_9SPHI|nr:lycopene cyclase family protein [Pedobacter westerhofensis]SMO93208.1 lycopene beta-cyclase [Pedobacter westerhofensis]
MYIKCDILICGGGLAGLSLLYRAMKLGIWEGQQIIVVDRSDKGSNDRTWSFWKKEYSCFEELIRHRWDQLVFFSNDGNRLQLNSGGYTYNSIKSIDFYHAVLSYLRACTNITFVQADVLSVSSAEDSCTLITPEHTYVSRYLFNSIYHQPELQAKEQYFLQHFKGIRIKTGSAVPPLSEAWLMDFRTEQKNGTTFFYTLPVANDELFIEYTLFSKSVLPMEMYDQQIKKYILEVLHIGQYEVLEDEYGVIPMTDHLFKRFEGNIVHIGTAGGDTRASTGYTFTNTQKTVGRILDSLQSAGHPFFKEENTGLKQQLYDATLLNVLAEGEYQGHQLFGDLFKKAPAYRIFAFLDSESSVLQDFFIMRSLRTMPFLKAFAGAVLNRLSRSN